MYTDASLEFGLQPVIQQQFINFQQQLINFQQQSINFQQQFINIQQQLQRQQEEFIVSQQQFRRQLQRQQEELFHRLDRIEATFANTRILSHNRRNMSDAQRPLQKYVSFSCTCCPCGTQILISLDCKGRP